jgi:hypothetical protein
MRIAPGRCDSTRLLRWLLGGLALLFLCPYSSLAWLDLNEQAPKAAEDKNKSRRVDAPVSAKTDRVNLTFDPE